MPQSVWSIGKSAVAGALFVAVIGIIIKAVLDYQSRPWRALPAFFASAGHGDGCDDRRLLRLQKAPAPSHSRRRI